MTEPIGTTERARGPEPSRLDPREVAGSLPGPLLERIGSVLGELLAIAPKLSYLIDRAHDLDTAVWDCTVDEMRDDVDPVVQLSIEEATGLATIAAIIDGLGAKIVRVGSGVPAEWREQDMRDVLLRVPLSYR